MGIARGGMKRNARELDIELPRVIMLKMSC